MLVSRTTSAFFMGASLFAITTFSSNSFAHPPDGYNMPRKYRTMEPPKTPIAPAQDNIDITKLSKECQTAIKNLQAYNDKDGNTDNIKASDIAKIKALQAKAKQCKAEASETTTEGK